jgi:putative ABC transport system permease protein
MLGGRDPIGLEVGGYRRGDGSVPRYRIVGVVGDLRTAIDESAPMPAVYVPAGATFWPILHVAARVDGDPAQLLPVVRALSADLAPDLAVEDVGPLDARIASALNEPRTRTWIVVAFAGVALTLAAIGLYGLLAGEVAARVKEIGIRLALGAAPSQVLGQAIRRGLGLATAGLALGLVGAQAASRLLEGVLAGRGSDDWLAFAGAFAVLIAVAVLASLAPAWRAARIDPNRALRTD